MLEESRTEPYGQTNSDRLGREDHNRVVVNHQPLHVTTSIDESGVPLLGALG